MNGSWECDSLWRQRFSKIVEIIQDANWPVDQPVLGCMVLTTNYVWRHNTLPTCCCLANFPLSDCHSNSCGALLPGNRTNIFNDIYKYIFRSNSRRRSSKLEAFGPTNLLAMQRYKKLQEMTMLEFDRKFAAQILCKRYFRLISESAIVQRRLIIALFILGCDYEYFYLFRSLSRG